MKSLKMFPKVSKLKTLCTIIEALLKNLVVSGLSCKIYYLGIASVFVQVKYQELVFWKYIHGLIFSFYMARVHTMLISTITTFH